MDTAYSPSLYGVFNSLIRRIDLYWTLSVFYFILSSQFSQILIRRIGFIHTAYGWLDVIGFIVWLNDTAYSPTWYGVFEFWQYLGLFLQVSIRRIMNNDTAYHHLYSVFLFCLLTVIVPERELHLFFLISYTGLYWNEVTKLVVKYYNMDWSIRWSFEAILSGCPTHLICL